MVNVGLRVPVDAKKRLVDESKSTGISEGTLARNYILLGMQVAQQRKAYFSPVLSQVLDVLESCPPAIQLQALEIAQVLAGTPTTPSAANIGPLEENMPVDFLIQIGDG